MNELKALLTTVSDRLSALIKKNAVVAKPIAIGDRHVLTLCELRIGLGGGGGIGEATEGSNAGKGTGGGAGGAAKATPVAVIVIENGKARVESLGQ